MKPYPPLSQIIPHTYNDHRFTLNGVRRWAGTGLAVLVAALMVGCAGPRPTLKPEVVAGVNGTRIRTFMPQTEVKAEFLQSTYGAGGGLVGAIVDVSVTSSRRQNAERRVQELRNQVKDVDFSALYWQAISNAVTGVSWLKAEGLDPINGLNLPPVTKEMVAGRGVLNIGADYYISQDCRVFVVTTGMGFYPRGKTGKPAGANIVAYHSAEIGKPDAEQAIALWTAGGAAAYRKAVVEGIQEHAKLVRYALEYMGGAANPTGPTVTIRARLLHARVDFGLKASRVTLKGNILEDRPERIIFRTTRGQFFSLPRAEVEVD